jgi:DNA-binding MarR family transcriptional regulator
MSSSGAPESPVGEFTEAFMGLVRSLGLLEPDHTPCGSPMSVAEAHALTILREGPLHQGELGALLHLGKSTTSRLTDGLEQRGWVRREVDPHDGRARLLVLTESGTEAAAGVVERRGRRLAELLDHIDPAHHATVIEALRLLKEASGRERS